MSMSMPFFKLHIICNFLCGHHVVFHALICKRLLKPSNYNNTTILSQSFLGLGDDVVNLVVNLILPKLLH